MRRDEWSAALLRKTWDYLKPGITRLNRSVEHEITWLSLAGHCLRPGYGYLGDQERILELWRLFSLGIQNKKEIRSHVQWAILWRKVSGGLNAEQQDGLFESLKKELNREEGVRLEAYRTLSVLELVEVEKKISLADQLLKQFKQAKINEALAWSFGRLCSRVLLTASSDKVIPASYLEGAFLRLEVFDWQDPSFNALARAMLLAGRKSDVENFNLKPEILNKLKRKVREAGVDEALLRVFDHYEPLQTQDERALFGETLPFGLSLFQS